VVLAQDESRALGHDYIGTEHLLLGLLREEEGLAAPVLAGLGIAGDEVRALVVRIVGRGDEVATGQIPFTPSAKKTLELALREALSLGHNYVGTEHLLLGLVRVNEGVAARVLLDFGADAESVRAALLQMLSGSNPTLAKRLAGVWSEEECMVEAVHDESPWRAAPRQSASGLRSGAAILVAGAIVSLIALTIGLLLGYLIWH
jgi:ATP-dependent Clp protease ATP-binding subunit ClpC